MTHPSSDLESLVVARLLGGIRWSSRGTLLHLVRPFTFRHFPSTGEALCGAKPKGSSHGWSHLDGVAATCKKCIDKEVKS